MANRKRDVQILLWVTPEEKKMIRKTRISWILEFIQRILEAIFLEIQKEAQIRSV